MLLWVTVKDLNFKFTMPVRRLERNCLRKIGVLFIPWKSAAQTRSVKDQIGKEFGQAQLGVVQ